MSLFLAQTDGTTNFEFGLSEQHIISIAKLDLGVGFNESTPTMLEGVTTVEVTYAQSEAGPTPDRLDALVQDTGFVNPEQIIAHGVPGNFVIAGLPITSIAGVAIPRGNADNPYTNHIATFYDTSQCNGSGYFVDKDGGGTTSFPSDVILYHELAHCFHFATGVASTEPLAEVDENDMRDVRGIDHRDPASHNGGCGGGPVNCCIVASLSTDSSYSEEIKKFRRLREQTLRRSVAGDEFFKEFFYRYYGFSPEVTRILGHQPNLNSVVKENFVIPLLSGAELLIFYSETKGIGLAAHLRERAEIPGLEETYQKEFLEESDGHLNLIRGTNDQHKKFVLNRKYGNYAGFGKLLEHIGKATIEDEYINWSLIDVIEIWVKSALLLHSGKSETEIDFEIYETIINWISKMPISKVWKDFSRLETEVELKSLEEFIFDLKSKEVFSERLIDKYPLYAETIKNWAEEERR